MPIMDGFEATRRIRKLERKGTLVGRLAIVALTANVSEECRTSCFDAGADHFLEKPLDMGKLKEYTGRYMGCGT
jgi:CheY-like chemotaxis protein